MSFIIIRILPTISPCRSTFLLASVFTPKPRLNDYFALATTPLYSVQPSSISGNGRYIVYATKATNLEATDRNIFQNVFVLNVETGAVQLISQTSDGQQGNNDSPMEKADKLAINYDGSWVTFPTKSNNVGTGNEYKQNYSQI